MRTIEEEPDQMLKPELTIDWAVQIFKAIGYDAQEIANLFDRPVSQIQPVWDDSGWSLALEAVSGEEIVFDGDVVVRMGVEGG